MFALPAGTRASTEIDNGTTRWSFDGDTGDTLHFEDMDNPYSPVDLMDQAGADSRTFSTIEERRHGGHVRLRCESIEPVPFWPGTFRLTYEGSSVVVALSMTTEIGYYRIEVADVYDPDGRLEQIEFIRLDTTAAWPAASWDDLPTASDLIVQAIPLTPETTCVTSPPDGSTAPTYSCRGHASMGFVGTAAALVTARSDQYRQVLDEMSQREGQPRVERQGSWFRHSRGGPYLFASVSQYNWGRFADLAHRGGFPQVLLADALEFGAYSRGRLRRHRSFGHICNWEWQQQFPFVVGLLGFWEDLQVGFHTQFGHTAFPNWGMPSFPPDSGPSWLYDVDAVLSVWTAHAADRYIGDVDSVVELDRNIEARGSIYSYYASKGWVGQNYFILDSAQGRELIRCELSENDDMHESTELQNCDRGLMGTPALTHGVHSPPAERINVRLVPTDGHTGSNGFMTEPVKFFLDPSAAQESAEGFAELACSTGVDFLYADMNTYVDEPGMDVATSVTYKFRHGLVPYLDAMEARDGCDLPVVQNGTAGWSYGFHYRDREATWDGVVFKSKEFTRNHKVDALKRTGEYSDALGEMGWWKVHGSLVGSELLDFGHYDPYGVYARGPWGRSPRAGIPRDGRAAQLANAFDTRARLAGVDPAAWYSGRESGLRSGCGVPRFASQAIEGRATPWTLEIAPSPGTLVSNGGSGHWDYDASTRDDVHYAMTKTLAMGRTIGLQLHESALDCRGAEYHGDLDGLFDLLALYHELADDAAAMGRLPRAAREALADPDVEAELRRTYSLHFAPFLYTYQFVRKQVTREYLAWPPADGSASFAVDNPFGPQAGVSIELRPRFQFDFGPGPAAPSADEGIEIAQSWSLEVAGGHGTCAWDVTGSEFTAIPADASEPLVCRVTAELGVASVDLSGHRGFALKAAASRAGALLVLHTSIGGGTYRDHKVELPVTPAPDWIVLADPTADTRDPYTKVDGTTGDLPLGYDNKVRRSWHFDYGEVETVQLLVAVYPGSTDPVTVTFDGPIALRESAPIWEVPFVEIDDGVQATTIRFVDDPVTAREDLLVLSLEGGREPAILRYRGWDGGTSGEYELLTQYESPYDTGMAPGETFSHDPLPRVPSGPLTVRVGSSRTSGPWTRAEVRVTFYDDEDRDGLPTHCLWDPDPAAHLMPCEVCDGSNDFCRDDDPSSPAGSAAQIQLRGAAAVPRPQEG